MFFPHWWLFLDAERPGGLVHVVELDACWSGEGFSGILEKIVLFLPLPVNYYISPIWSYQQSSIVRGWIYIKFIIIERNGIIAYIHNNDLNLPKYDLLETAKNPVFNSALVECVLTFEPLDGFLKFKRLKWLKFC